MNVRKEILPGSLEFPVEMLTFANILLFARLRERSASRALTRCARRLATFGWDCQNPAHSSILKRWHFAGKWATRDVHRLCSLPCAKASEVANALWAHSTGCAQEKLTSGTGRQDSLNFLVSRSFVLGTPRRHRTLPAPAAGDGRMISDAMDAVAAFHDVKGFQEPSLSQFTFAAAEMLRRSPRVY